MNKFENKEEDTNVTSCKVSDETDSKTFVQRVKLALKYAFVDMMQDIGKWLLMGLVIAGLITVFVPESFFALFADKPLLSMLLVLAFAIPMYLCATGSIPIAVALMLKGLSPGTALVLLMALPVTAFAAENENTEVVTDDGGESQHQHELKFDTKVPYGNNSVLCYCNQNTRYGTKHKVSIAEYEAGNYPKTDEWMYSSFWYKDFDGMAMKTMIRQLISKWGVMSVEMQDAIAQDIVNDRENGGDNADFNYVADAVVDAPVVDVETGEVKAESEDQTAISMDDL